jgi:hypothetical protein
MKTDDVDEESLGDGLDGVRVSERDEVGIFAEPVDHGEYDRLAPHARERLDEVDGDVRPHTLRYWQREKEAGRMQVLRLVALARDTLPNKVLYYLLHVRKMKIAPEPVESLLHPFMASFMHGPQDLLQEGGRRRDVEAACALHHAVDHRPWSPTGARAHFIMDGGEGRVGELCLPKTRGEVEARGRQDQDDPFLRCVVAGECVSHHVRRPGLVLDGEVKAQKLAHPMMLRDRREALIEHVLQAVVIGLDEEATPPKVRPPIEDGLDKADEFALIGGEGAVAWRYRPAEERHRVAFLDEDRAEAVRRSITFDDERLGEVRHGEDRSGGDGRLEGVEGRCCLFRPLETILLKKGSQRRGDGPVIVDELAMVPAKPRKPWTARAERGAGHS